MISISSRTTLIAIAAALFFPAAPVAYADPPSHAPAHGWRKKHDPYYTGYSGKQWDRDYGIMDGNCNREAIGTVLGGAVGGVVGSTVGKGDGKTVAIILGTVLGAVVGNRIGKSMDDSDRACIGHALELTPNNRSVRWQGGNGLGYQLTPLRDYDLDGRKCRDYRLRINGNNIDEDRRERACLENDGNWHALEH